MHTIQIEDDVFAALEARVRGFHDSPSSVIKRLLIEPITTKDARTSGTKDRVPKGLTLSDLVELVASPRYLTLDAKERYFEVLTFLYRKHPNDFRSLESYRRGSRVNFARDTRTIENSGKSTHPQKIPGTPYHALTNMDNRRKREILQDVLRMFRYPAGDISMVLKSIPDSGISRPKRIGLHSLV